MKTREWFSTTLGKVTGIYDGPHATPAKTQDGPWYLSISSLVDGRLDLSQSAHISEEDFKIWTKRVKPEAGDVVFSYETRLGEAALMPDGLRCALGRRMGLLRPDRSRIDPQFLAYAYLGPEFQHAICIRISHGSTVNRILLTEMGDFPIRLPPLSEQRKIAQILGTWDEAITLIERRIEAARQRKKGLMQRLLTGRVRFPQFAGRKWQEVQLGNLAEVKRGASPRPIRDPKWFAESGRGWIRIADVTDSPTRFLNKTSQYLSPLGESKSVKVEIGELIMSICATIGVPKIVNIPACIHDGFVVFRGYGKHLHREFLYHYLNFITERLANRGQPGTQKNLNSTLVRKIRVPKPPLAEQERIAAVLQSCDREIELLTQKRDALQRQKKGLVQRLLTGRVQV